MEALHKCDDVRLRLREIDVNTRQVPTDIRPSEGKIWSYRLAWLRYQQNGPVFRKPVPRLRATLTGWLSH